MRTLSIALLLVVGTGGCGLLPRLTPYPPPAGWMREELRGHSGSCWDNECRLRLSFSDGDFNVATDARVFARHEIPGWKETRASRAATGVLGWIFRRVGGTTDRIMVGLGVQSISATDGDGWQLRCSSFWIEAEEREYDRDEGVAITTRTERRTQGRRCSAINELEPDVVRWRFEEGIAPPLDSVAMVYDSLVAVGSPAVSGSPPMSLDRFTPAGELEERYSVVADSGLRLNERVHVARANGEPLAVLQGPLPASLDLAPDATPEERRILRLIAATMALHH